MMGICVPFIYRERAVHVNDTLKVGQNELL